MIELHPQYITDESGNKISAVIPMQEFNIIVNKLNGSFNKNSQNDVIFPKQKLSDFAGKLSSKTAEEMQKYVAKSRNEWEERINKQFNK